MRRRQLLKIALPALAAVGLPGTAHALDMGAPMEAPEDAPQADPLDWAYQFLGLPYIWASAAGRTYFGDSPRGFDCSGWAAFIQRRVYGRTMPAYTAAAWQVSVPVDRPESGDLAFFNMQYASPRLQHVAIVIDPDTIIQAGGVRGNVNLAPSWSVGRPTFRRLISN